MSDNNENKNKDIEVVEGIGNLDISPVYENLTSMKPKMQDEKPKNIFVPPVKKSNDKENDEDTVSVEIDDNEENNNTSEEINDDELINTVEEDNQIEDSMEDDDIEILFEDADLDDDIDESNIENTDEDD